VDEGGE
jgi:hypothetical protein